MEIWKDVKEYEGIYEVSNIGRVRSLNRVDSSGKSRKGKILKQTIGKSGYKQVNLCKNCKQKLTSVHRLVAMAFIDNPDNLPMTGHLNDKKTDNNVNNLYWTNAKENNIHNERHLKAGVSKRIKVKGILNGIMVVFESITEAGKNGFDASAITRCLRDERKTHKGYKWLKY